jgi:molybdopterin molybdotransferase
MITVERAQELISKNVRKHLVRKQSIDTVVNFFLAEDVISRFDIPMFSQSAMDGYAFKFADRNSPLDVINEIAAGDVKLVTIKNGEAVRIFTGSKIPDTCDTVVMQELSERDGDK